MGTHKVSHNYREMRRLILSIRSIPNSLNLLMAICADYAQCDKIISAYEEELTALGVHCHQQRIDDRLSLKDSLRLAKAQMMMDGIEPPENPSLVTIVGASDLNQERLGEPKSDQEKFFFSLQWTRESLRAFPFPVVLWLTPDVATVMAQQAPDFWSWRGGEFEFIDTSGGSQENA